MDMRHSLRTSLSNVLSVRFHIGRPIDCGSLSRATAALDVSTFTTRR